MTSEKLYGLIKFLDTLDTKLGLQKSLEAVVTALTNLVTSPAQPQYQSDLAGGPGSGFWYPGLGVSVPSPDD
jgi:hypothetical protein